MTYATPMEVKTLGEYAYQTIKKNSAQIWKWETAVKDDKGSEALHQMRIEMRHLSFSISGFATSVILPESVNNKNIAKIYRHLGRLRDLDLLKESCCSLKRHHLPSEEQEFLQTALDTLDKQRQNTLLEVRKKLKNQRYKLLKQELNQWLRQPTYQPLASKPILEVIPDSLLSCVSHFLLHPAWLVGSQLEVGEVIFPKYTQSEKIEQKLTQKAINSLHDLRKQAKILCYQMQSFADLYGFSYEKIIAQINNIQTTLGLIQESVLLNRWITDFFQLNIRRCLPIIAILLADNRYNSWRKWQLLQQKYAKAETKLLFYSTIVNSWESLNYQYGTVS